MFRFLSSLVLLPVQGWEAEGPVFWFLDEDLCLDPQRMFPSATPLLWVGSQVHWLINPLLGFAGPGQQYPIKISLTLYELHLNMDAAKLLKSSNLYLVLFFEGGRYFYFNQE